MMTDKQLFNVYLCLGVFSSAAGGYLLDGALGVGIAAFLHLALVSAIAAGVRAGKWLEREAE